MTRAIVQMVDEIAVGSRRCQPRFLDNVSPEIARVDIID